MPVIETELPYNFTPWPFQEEIFDAFYEDGKRRFFEVWPRRHGKDKTFLNLMIDQMMQRVGNYCHVFPQRNRARRIVWQGIDNDGLRYTDHFPPELIYRKSEQEMTISLIHPEDPTREGSIYWCMGSDKDTNFLVGANPVAVLWSEFGEMSPRLRELVLPILRRNDGWEAIIMTPRGRNHAYRIYNLVRDNPDWHARFLLRHEAHDHDGKQIVTDADVQADIAAGMEERTARQEYDLSWDAPMPGAYYGDEFDLIDREGRIRDVPYDPLLPVYTSWNLGWDETNSIWFFQLAGREVRFIDYEEGSNIPLARPEGLHDADAAKRNWIDIVRAKPYIYDHAKVPQSGIRDSYEVHYGPHDLEQHEYSYGKTRYTIALQHGLRFTVTPRKHTSGPGTIDPDGIAAARALLARSVFDQTRCARGTDAVRSYKRQRDEKREVFLNHPEHDWAHSGADSFRYAAVGLMPPPQPAKPGPPPGSFASTLREYDRYRRTGRPMRPPMATGSYTGNGRH